MKKSKYFDNEFSNKQYGLNIFKDVVGISEFGGKSDYYQNKQYLLISKKQFKEIIATFKRYEK